MAERKQARDDDTPILEWIAGAAGLVLFVAALVVTLQNAFSQSEPPDITISQGPAVAVEGGWRVELEVENRGDETAAAVTVVAELRLGEEVVEEHDVVVDFLPPHSKAHAGVFLQRDPANLELTIAASSYQRP